MKALNYDKSVVQFYGACLQGNNLTLVQEYMEGGWDFPAVAVILSMLICRQSWFQNPFKFYCRIAELDTLTSRLL